MRCKTVSQLVQTLMCVVVIAACSSTGETSTKAPVSELTLIDDSTVTFADHDATVLMFGAEWCTPCRRELPAAQELRDEYEATKEPDVAFVAVGYQEEEDVFTSFLSELDVDLLTAVDPTGSLMSEFGLVGLPSTLVITQGGDVSWTYAGEFDIDELRTNVDNAVAV